MDLPHQKGLKPSYEQRHFSRTEKRDRFHSIVDPDGDYGAVTIHQDVRVFACCLGDGRTVEHVVSPNRSAWVQLARGAVALNGNPMKEGDGAALVEGKYH